MKFRVISFASIFFSLNWLPLFGSTNSSCHYSCTNDRWYDYGSQNDVEKICGDSSVHKKVCRDFRLDGDDAFSFEGKWRATEEALETSLVEFQVVVRQYFYEGFEDQFDTSVLACLPKLSPDLKVKLNSYFWFRYMLGGKVKRADGCFYFRQQPISHSTNVLALSDSRSQYYSKRYVWAEEQLQFENRYSDGSVRVNSQFYFPKHEKLFSAYGPKGEVSFVYDKLENELRFRLKHDEFEPTWPRSVSRELNSQTGRYNYFVTGKEAMGEEGIRPAFLKVDSVRLDMKWTKVSP